MKYSYHGQVLDHDFIDAEEADWYAWRKTGSPYFGQSSLVGPNGYIYFIDDYGINFNGLLNAIDRVIYGEGSDTDAPYVYYKSPNDGATDVDPHTDIKFRLKDDGFGIDESSVTIEVEYPGSGGPVAGTLTEESGSNFLDYKGLFNPTGYLPLLTEITVSVNAKDILNNTMTEEVWTFTIAATGVESASLGEIKATFK